MQLHIVDDDFVELPAGNPGHITKLRIDFTVDEVIIYEPLSQRSQTYMYDPESGAASELFYFDRFKLRIPLRFATSNESAHSLLYHAAPHAGVLGLGRGSPLWRYWREFTLAGDVLLLGAYDEAHMPRRGPALPLGVPLAATLSSLRPIAATLHGERQWRAPRDRLTPTRAESRNFSRSVRESVADYFLAAQSNDIGALLCAGAPATRQRSATPDAESPAWAWSAPEAATVVFTLGDADAALPEPHFLAPFVRIVVGAKEAPGAPDAPADGTDAAGASEAAHRDDARRGAARAGAAPLTGPLELLLGDASHRLPTPAGFAYYALRRAPRATLRVGTTVLRRFSLHVDWVRGELRLAPSFWGAAGGSGAFSGRVGVARENMRGDSAAASLDDALPGAALDVNLVGALLLLAGALAWLLVAADETLVSTPTPASTAASTSAQETAQDSARAARRALALLQFYVHVLSLLLYVTNAVVLDTRALVAHYARGNGAVLLAFLGVCVVPASVLGLATSVATLCGRGAVAAHGAAAALESGHHASAPLSSADRGTPVRAQRSALVLAAVCALWLAALPRHDDGGGAGAVMMFVACAAAACGLLVTLLASHGAVRDARHRFAHRLWLAHDAAAAALACALVLRLNACALVGGGGASGADVWLPALLLWTVAVLAPAFSLYVAYELRALVGALDAATGTVKMKQKT